MIATGSIEQPLVFGNNDLPGVMLGGAARRLVNQFRIAARRARPWCVTSDDEGIEAALDLADGRRARCWRWPTAASGEPDASASATPGSST